MKVKIPKLRWFIAGLLLMATVINYTDRLTLSVVIPEVRHHLLLSDEDYAQIVSMFLFAYAIMYAVSGYVVDRLGTRKGFAVFISTWSLAEILHGFAKGKGSLAFYRFLLGLAEPGNFPAQPPRPLPNGFRQISAASGSACSTPGHRWAPRLLRPWRRF